MSAHPACTRRALLHGGLGSLAWVLAGPSPRAWAQGALEREHAPRLEMPILAEDSAAVPLQISVDHPMEPDHFIRSIEVTLDKDPVPWKGKFNFTPGNGRAWAAFTMRSGTGGLVRAVAECSKHGRFTGTREVRVAEGGCATSGAPIDRTRIGNPQLRLPSSPKAGQIVEARTKVDHDSNTGLVAKGGKLVREQPEFYVKEMAVYLDAEKICEFQMSSAISANPLIRFPLKVTRSGTVKVVFVNSEGQRWETSQPLKL
jgi:sulfur-oxidizing protein SoxY